MIKRLFDLTRKAWIYLLTALEQPQELPYIVWLVSIRAVHLGELLKLNRYKKWLKTTNIRTVIDVGAHTGEFASAIKAILPEAYVYSFEPLLDCHPKLARRLAKYERFQAFCVALGDSQGEVTFWRSDFTKSSSVLRMSDLHKKTFPWTEKSIPITVQIHRLVSCQP